MLREYLARFYQLSEKVDIYNLRIEEFSRMPEYEQKVRHLCCMNGIATHTAMCAIAEIGDFNRFSSAEKFSAFLGLVPGERSSGDKEHRTRITKHGNAHLRRLLVEATQSYSRGAVGKKSGRLKKRQAGQLAEDHLPAVPNPRITDWPMPMPARLGPFHMPLEILHILMWQFCRLFQVDRGHFITKKEDCQRANVIKLRSDPMTHFLTFCKDSLKMTCLKARSYRKILL